MLLQDRKAIIYGAGGSLGSVISKSFAGAGATVILAGRNPASLEKVALEIQSAGGKAKVASVDALQTEDVQKLVDKVVREDGRLDISCCLIDFQSVQDIPLTDMSVEDFLRPVTIATRSQFLTSTAAGRVMKKQGTGLILSLTATPGGIGYPMTGGFSSACSAMEAFTANLGSELGVYGVRVVNMRSAGSPDSHVFKDALEKYPEVMDSALRKMEDDTMLKRLPVMEDIANAAVFLASDLARAITGVTVDLTCGTTAALNYRVERTSHNGIHQRK